MVKVFLYETRRGEKPIESFISKLNTETIAKVAHTIDLLEKHGYKLGLPHSKGLTKNLYELRVRGKEEVRIIYTFKSNSVYLLHAFKKKSRKTPKKEISTAINRLIELN
ncbi:type II toxin-antitoxin system RelE/ParE family toxin [Patescibacteria group bacterium]|nr:type II toxin-antitoxin system RelE/ParE family toxin [Patescibacteria group bacterium]